MKNITLTILLALGCLKGYSSIPQKESIVMRVFEAQNLCTKGGIENQIYISYSDGKSQKIDLTKLKDNDVFSSNTNKINEAINKQIKDGYSVQSSSTCMWECFMITTIILVKE